MRFRRRLRSTLGNLYSDRPFAKVMKRTTRMSGFGYLASAVGVLLFGLLALLVMRGSPATGAIMLLAVSVALAGLALRWHKRVQRRRRRANSFQLQI